MECFQARVDSFLKSKRIKKTSKSNSASTTVKWPHPASFNANPTSLAEAGFYWSPSWKDRDTVICFLCSKELSDWDQEDDPLEIHWERCGHSCAWAMVRCGLSQDTAEDGGYVFSNKERVPTTKIMEGARLRTFGENLWPHDVDDDHGASSQKVAHAGFVYTPESKGDDTVTCLYCGVTLAGWDKDDDPMLEHKKRATKFGKQCPFFSPPGGKSSHSKKISSLPTAPPPESQARKTRAVSRTRSKRMDVDISPDSNPESSDSGDELAESEVVEEVQAPRTRGKGRVASTSKPPPKPVKKAPSRPKTTRTRISKSALAGSFKSAIINPSEAEPIASEVEMHVIASEAEHLMLEANVDAPAGGEDTPVQQIHTQDDLIHHDQQSNVADLDDIGDTPNPPPRPEIPDDDHVPMVVDETSQACGRGSCHPPSHLPSPLPPCQSVPLTALPALHLEILAPEDRCLTVEQWIRREIEISYDQLRQDGRKQISLFEGRAKEVRQIIEAL